MLHKRETGSVRKALYMKEYKYDAFSMLHRKC